MLFIKSGCDLNKYQYFPIILKRANLNYLKTFSKTLKLGREMLKIKPEIM